LSAGRESALRRVARIAAGSGLLAAGTAMLVLPGPGLLAIALGLALLAKNVSWARRAFDSIEKRGAGLRDQVRGRFSN
jgi:hypothetical protein